MISIKDSMMTKSKAQKRKAKKQRAQNAAATMTPRKPRARRQRRRMAVGSVGVASVARNFMRPMRSTTAGDGHMCRFKGTDFLTAITIGGTNAAAGDVLYTAVVNPKTLGVSRLATVSALWERYKFKSLKFRYAPVAPTTTAGQLMGYVDYDTYDDPTGLSGPQNLQRAAAHYGQEAVQVWQGQEKPVFWAIKDVDPLTDLYVDSDGTDPRWTNQGRFVLLAASAIASGTACGNIYLDYDVEFYIPQLELTPNNGFADKFTGSTSCTTSALLGTTVAGATWNNLPLKTAVSGNTFTLPPGSYYIYVAIAGTTVSAVGLSGGTQVKLLSNQIGAGSSSGSAFAYCYSASDFTVTMSATAAAISSGELYIALIPSNAVTMTQRRLTQISRLLNLVQEVDKLKDALTSQADKEASPADQKESKLVLTGETGSMSALASGCMGTTSPKIPFASEDYYVVPKRGTQTPRN